MGCEMSFLRLIKPESLSGDKDTVNVEDFLDGVELSFPCFDQIADKCKRERAKVLALQSHLDGKAKQFWLLYFTRLSSLGAISCIYVLRNDREIYGFSFSGSANFRCAGGKCDLTAGLRVQFD